MRQRMAAGRAVEPSGSCERFSKDGGAWERRGTPPEVARRAVSGAMEEATDSDSSDNVPFPSHISVISRLALDDAHVAAGLVGPAAEALAGLVGDELSEDYIIPAAFDPRVGPTVAKAVAEAARRSGVARI